MSNCIYINEVHLYSRINCDWLGKTTMSCDLSSAVYHCGDSCSLKSAFKPCGSFSFSWEEDLYFLSPCLTSPSSSKGKVRYILKRLYIYTWDQTGWLPGVSSNLWVNEWAFMAGCYGCFSKRVASCECRNNCSYHSNT